jgi:hypothetical protein
VYSVLVLDTPGGGLTVQTALDAAGPGVVPTGGVEAGAGGTAAPESPPPVVAAVIGGALAVGAALVATARAGAPHGRRHVNRSRTR